jgi:hypothetical protein
MIRKKYCGTAAKAGGNGENRPQSKTMGVPYLLEKTDMAANDSPSPAETGFARDAMGQESVRVITKRDSRRRTAANAGPPCRPAW